MAVTPSSLRTPDSVTVDPLRIEPLAPVSVVAVSSPVTTKVADPELPPYFESPAKLATTGYEPAASCGTKVHVASPDAFVVPLQVSDAFSVNVSVLPAIGLPVVVSIRRPFIVAASW